MADNRRDHEFALHPIAVVVVAADRFALAGLVAMLEDQDGLSVVAAHDLNDEPSGMDREASEVVIVDMGWEAPLPDDDRLEPWLGLGPPVLLLSEAEDGSLMSSTLVAEGQLARHRVGAAIHAAVSALASGLRIIDPELARFPPRPIQIPEPLTGRELEVLRLLAEGQSNRAIGHTLSISEHTVKFHMTSIFNKLGAESRTEAAMLGVRAGLIPL